MKQSAVIIAALMTAGPVQLPRPLLTQLDNHGARERCDGRALAGPRRLDSGIHLSLADGRLLVFLQVPDGACQSNDAIPVVVEPSGHLVWGAALGGLVTNVSGGADGTLWAAGRGVIDGAPVPLLWTSRNALDWTPVELPARRSTRGHEEKMVALCPGDQGLCIELEAPLELGVLRALLWRDAAPPFAWGIAATCAPCQPGDTAGWTREVAEDDAGVVYRQGKASVTFPVTLRSRR
jgi:hypothetical protein